MENLEIKITLEKDRKTINLVDISGSEHYMFEESEQEKERYLNMSVREFIADYVKYYESTEEDTIYEQAEELAEKELCKVKCLCPALKESGLCSSCEVFMALREYHKQEIEEEKEQEDDF
jgi:hypothetical protein